MAYTVFDITCITNIATTEPTGNGGLMFYGAKFGTTGYYIKLPKSAPAIGDCCTTTPTMQDSWGLYIWMGTTSLSFNIDETPFCACGPLKVSSFEKGGRWIEVGTADGFDAAAIVPVDLLQDTSRKKRLEFYYRSVAECGKPVRSTL